MNEKSALKQNYYNSPLLKGIYCIRMHNIPANCTNSEILNEHNFTH